MEEAFQQLRADARAFAESAFTVDVPEGATPEEEDARLKEAFNERVKQFGALERQLAVFAKRDAHRAAAAWTDIADIRLTLAEDYLAAVPAHLAPEQAAVVAESASIRADKMRGAASDALEAASAAPDITPEERAAMEAAGRRLQASLDE